mgnify:CR=1 FL=1
MDAPIYKRSLRENRRLFPPEGIALPVIVEIHPERFEFVGGDLVGEFLLQHFCVFLGDLRPQFVALVDLAADGRPVDRGGDGLA